MPLLLPEPLPDEPLTLFAQWFAEAKEKGAQPNPDAMVIATADVDGKPSARVVLCKQLVATPGYVVFFTNYHSRKGRELAARPRAAAVFHWDTMQRQVRLEGPIVRSPTPESDAYFATRSLASRIGAWASQQSEPLASRMALAAQVSATTQRFNLKPDTVDVDIPRPPYWGGFRLWPDTVELWVEGAGRVHDRACWIRRLKPQDEFSFLSGTWEATRLNP